MSVVPLSDDQTKRKSSLKPDGSPEQMSEEELSYNTFYPGLFIADMKTI